MKGLSLGLEGPAFVPVPACTPGDPCSHSARGLLLLTDAQESGQERPALFSRDSCLSDLRPLRGAWHQAGTEPGSGSSLGRHTLQIHCRRGAGNLPRVGGRWALTLQPRRGSARARSGGKTALRMRPCVLVAFSVFAPALAGMRSI